MGDHGNYPQNGGEASGGYSQNFQLVQLVRAETPENYEVPRTASEPPTIPSYTFTFGHPQLPNSTTHPHQFMNDPAVSGNHAMPRVSSFSSSVSQPRAPFPTQQSQHQPGPFHRPSSNGPPPQDYVELPPRGAHDPLDQITYSCIEELRKLEAIIKHPPGCLSFHCYNYQMIHQLATKLPQTFGELVGIPHMTHDLIQFYGRDILDITSKYRQMKQQWMNQNKENSRTLVPAPEGRRFGTQLFPQATWQQQYMQTGAIQTGTTQIGAMQTGTTQNRAMQTGSNEHGAYGTLPSHGSFVTAAATTGLHRTMRDLKRTATTVQHELVHLNRTMEQHHTQPKRTQVSVTMNIRMNGGGEPMMDNFSVKPTLGDMDMEMDGYEDEDVTDSSDSDYTPTPIPPRRRSSFRGHSC